MPVDAITRLMRTELRAPSSATIESFLQWLRKGVGVFLPAQMRQSGWRATGKLVEISQDGAETTQIAETSWFGEKRLRSDAAAPALPAQIAISESQVFVTQFSLPAEAAGRADKAAALRLGELSPVPPEDATFAVGKVRPAGAGRALVEIAIAKKKTLERVKAQTDGKTVAAIGAMPDSAGALRFIFERHITEAQPFTHRMLNMAIPVAAAFFLVFAVSAYQERRLQTLEAHETALLSALRDLRADQTLFDSADDATLKTAGGRPFSAVLGDIRETLAELPAGARIARIHAVGDRLEIAGFTPADADDQASAIAGWSTTRSDRPSYDRFMLRRDMSAAP